MNNEFLDYVEDIIEAMDNAETLLEGASFDELADDFRINYAVVRALEKRQRDCRRGYAKSILIYRGGIWLECATGSSTAMTMSTTASYGVRSRSESP